MKNNPLLSFILFFSFSICSFGQTNSYKNAERKFEAGEYLEALDYYKAAYKKVKTELKADCLWKTAECYRMLEDWEKAQLYYEKALLAKSEHAEQAQKYIDEIKKKKAIQEKKKSSGNK